MEKQECTYKCPNRRRCKILTELVCEYKKCTFFKPVNHDAGENENDCGDESGSGSENGGESDSGCAVNESDKNTCGESKRDEIGCKEENGNEKSENGCGNASGCRSESAGFSDG